MTNQTQFQMLSEASALDSFAGIKTPQEAASHMSSEGRARNAARFSPVENSLVSQAFKDLKTSQETTVSQASEKGEFRRGALSAPMQHYPTGTLALGVSQQAIDSVSHLRDFSIDVRFRKLTRLIDQLDKEFTSHSIRCLVNPLPLLDLMEKEYVETVDDLSDEQRRLCRWEIETFDGVPTLAGYPLWERLPTEQQDYFFLFKLFRDQKYGYLTTGEPYVLSRSISGLAEELKLSPNTLYLFAKLFHWKQRSAAYDCWQEREKASREQRYRQIIQKDHLHYARELTQQAFSKLKDCNNLKPRDLLAMMELGLHYSRISIGLPADKPEGMDSRGNTQTTIFSVNDNSGQTTQNLNMNVDAANSSQVVKDYGQQIKSEDTIRSILHVLQRSGAVNVTVNDLLRQRDPSEEVVSRKSSDKLEEASNSRFDIYDGKTLDLPSTSAGSYASLEVSHE